MKFTKKQLKKMRKLDREDSWVGPTTGRWLWDESRKLRDNNLRKFWSEWNSMSVLTSIGERYTLLVKMTEQVYAIHSLGKVHNARTRNRFNAFKEKDFPLEGRVCGCCGGPAEIRHHIVPVKNGGHNHGLNMMPLCNSCHVEIHPWMVKDKQTG